MTIYILFSLLLSLANMTQLSKEHKELTERFDKAAENITRLSPMEFEYVPAEVQRKLSEMGCTIPQATWRFKDKKHNIVSGQFATPEQTDWAALCSRDGRSTIVVLWGGSVNCRSEVLVARDDYISLQHTAVPERNSIGFSRVISRASPWTSALSGSDVESGVPSMRTHDAINHAFLAQIIHGTC